MNYGEILQSARDHKNLSIKEASRIVKIPERTLEGFESGNQEFLPARVYARGFLKKYCDFLSLQDQIPVEEYLSHLFREQDAVFRSSGIIESSPVSLRPSVILFFIIGAVGFGLTLYFFYQFRFFIARPNVTIDEPKQDVIIENDFMHISGMVDSGSILTLNGRRIYSSETGEFKERVSLSHGLNTLEFEVTNKTGKTAKIVRYVFVKEKSEILNSESETNSNF